MPSSKANQIKRALGGRAALEVLFIELPSWAIDRGAIPTGVSWRSHGPVRACYGKADDTVVAVDQVMPKQPRAVVEAEVARRLAEEVTESRRLRTRALVAEVARLRTEADGL